MEMRTRALALTRSLAKNGHHTRMAPQLRIVLYPPKGLHDEFRGFYHAQFETGADLRALSLMPNESMEGPCLHLADDLGQVPVQLRLRRPTRICCGRAPGRR